jgi:hypothetical protein
MKRIKRCITKLAIKLHTSTGRCPGTGGGHCR